MIRRGEMNSLAPVRVEKIFAIDIHKARNQAPVCVVGLRLDREIHHAEEFRQVVGAQGQARDHAEAASATTLERPEEVGIVARVDRADPAIRGHDLGLQQIRRRGSVPLGPAAEAAAADQARDADRQAATALHVTAALRRHRVVGVAPDLACADADRGLRRHLPSATPRHECVEHLHLIHVMRPHQQRIRRVGGALIAVSGAFHHQPQMMFAREIDGGGDVGRGTCRHRVRARLRGPCIHPARALGQVRMIEVVIRIADRVEEIAARLAGWIGATGGQRISQLHQPPAHPFVQHLPLRGGRPARLAGTHPAQGARCRHGFRPCCFRKIRQQRREQRRTRQPLQQRTSFHRAASGCESCSTGSSRAFAARGV